MTDVRDYITQAKQELSWEGGAPSGVIVLLDKALAEIDQSEPDHSLPT